MVGYLYISIVPTGVPEHFRIFFYLNKYIYVGQLKGLWHQQPDHVAETGGSDEL